MLRRLGLLAGVAIAHVLLLAGLLRAFDVQVLPHVSTATLASIIAHRPTPPPPAPPPPRVTLAAARPPDALLIAVPLPAIEVPVPPTPPLSADIVGAAAHSTAGPRRTPIAFVSAPINEDAYYPPDASIRGQAGNVLTLVCVGVRDQVVDARVLKSSGSRPLDLAALQVARHSTWHAARINGQPITDCSTFLVNFILHHHTRVF